MKLVKNIIFSILAFCITSNAFGQNENYKNSSSSFESLINRMKNKNLSDIEIKSEIQNNEKSSKIDFQNKINFDKNKINKKIICDDIPASEKAVLQNIYNQLNGISWATNWNFNTPVTSWVQANASGWFGITVSNCHVTEINIISEYVQGNTFPDLTNLTELKTLRLGKPTNITAYSYPVSQGDLSSIGNLNYLESLSLSYFNLNTIPSNFNYLADTLKVLSLEFCNINNNQLCSVIANLNNLNSLDLSFNYIENSLPTCFNPTNFPNLRTLNGFANKLNDISTLSTFTNLPNIYFGWNFINNLPNLTNNTNLRILGLNGNLLSGNVPSYFSGFSFRTLAINYNNFSGTLPLINREINPNTGSNNLFIQGNNFRFLDFSQDFSYYNNFAVNNWAFSFSPQNKTDVPKNETKSVGQSTTMIMCEDNRFHPNDTFQWFKNGIAINGANSRTYTISSLSIADNGTYTCKSYHTSNPDMSPLILEREPITLNVTNCTPIVGESKFDDCGYFKTTKACAYTCGNRTVYPYFTNAPHTNVYKWVFKSPDGTILNTVQNMFGFINEGYTFTTVGNNTIELTITAPDGCITTTNTVTVPVIACCTPFVGNIITSDLPEGQNYTCGNRSTLAYLDFDENIYSNLNLEWTFLSPTNEVLGTYNSNTDVNESATFNFTTIGNNTIQLVVTEPNGCKTTLRPVTIAVNSCAIPCEQEIHFNFNFKVPFANKGGILNNNERENIANGISEFVNNTLSENLLLTTFDDFSTGVRTTAVQNNFNTTVVDATTNASNETQVTNLLRFQDDYYNNTFTNIISDPTTGIINNTTINKRINISFFVLTEDKFSDINAARNAYLSLLSNKADKVFFILMNEGRFRNTVNNTLLTPQEFVSQVKNQNSVDFATTNNVLTSDYIIYNRAQITDPNFKITLSAFLNTALSKVKEQLCNAGGNCTKTNPRTPTVKALFCALVTKLLSLNPNTITNGFTCPELVALAPYITDPNPAIYNFTIANGRIKFSFTNHSPQGMQDIEIETDIANIPIFGQMTDVDVSSYSSADIQLDRIPGYFANGFAKMYIKHINFCPNELISCTKTNPRTPIVKQKFIALMNYLGSIPANSVINGFTCQQLYDLGPYLSDANPKIYNFSNNNGWLKFSFTNHDANDNQDVGGLAGIRYDIVDINVDQFIDANTHANIAYTINGGPQDGYTFSERNQIRHINFCPDDLCKNHIAIVVDESGSIDVFEKAKIKRQLKKFIKKQAELNDANPNWNMHISLIGLSDKDKDYRTDHVLYQRVSALPGNSTIELFNEWIDGPANPTTANANQGRGYGNRYGLASHPGVSGGSDFWKSGLDKALEAQIPPKLVILITDGSQTAIPFTNANNLKTTLSKFNNYSLHDGPLEESKPHLYVIGMDNGFYVYDEQSALRQLPTNEDPNYVPSLRSSSPTSRTTPALSLSLKFLMGLENAEFPTNSLNTIAHSSNNPDFKIDDYIGLNNMDIIGDPTSTFMSDNMEDVYTYCGSTEPKDLCEDCYSFQPIPGRWYVLNAWAKEERNVQVQKYSNPMIKLNFYDINDSIIINDLSDPNNITQYPSIFGTKGEIIEGWQRIGDKFKVPANAVYMEVELLNEGNSIPVFFDDIRIYPIKGSVKSFVYDPENFRLMSELDENNYATYYEYDNEGGLVRIKKETVKGIKTIQETRSGNVIKVE